MELDELITVWQSNDAKIDKTVKLNIKTLDLILTQKVKSALRSVFWQRVVEAGFHSIALILLLLFLAKNIDQWPYALSALALIAFYGFILINCLKQLQIMSTIESNENIVSKQQSLLKVQTHLLNFIRLSVISIPTFLSYPVVISKAFADADITVFGDFDLIKRTNGNWWTIELIVYLVLVPLGIWFYNQVTVKNIHKKWVARIIKRSSSARVTKAIEYLNELDELKGGEASRKAAKED